MRELDEALALARNGSRHVRGQSNRQQHQLVPWLRQSINNRLAGYEDANDAEGLSVDSAMRHVVGGRAALTGQTGRFRQ